MGKHIDANGTPARPGGSTAYRGTGDAADQVPSIHAQIKDRVDLREVIADRVEWSKRVGKSLSTLCPFHADTQPSLAVYVDHFHCYVCAAHGDIFDWLERVDDMTQRAALSEGARLAEVALPARRTSRGASGTVRS